jgi:hypothetical protein
MEMRTITAALAALALVGCASQTGWMKADGSATTPEQRKLAMSICEGEVQKASIAVKEDKIRIDPNRGLTKQNDDVYRGCMAQQGFVQVEAGR